MVGPIKLGYSLDVNQCNCPLTQTESQYQFVDNLAKISGNHSFKFGTDLRYAQNLRVPSDSHRAGDLAFSGNATGIVGASGGSASPGVALATYLLGDVTSFDRYVSSSTNASEHQPRFFFYGQDEWRPTPKLTITYGLRWEMIFPESVNAAGNGATYNLNNDQIYVFGEGGTSLHGIQTMNWHEFAPRLSIAYQITPKTVIRAGYGWSYDLGVFGSNFGHNVTQNPPVLSQQNLTPTQGNYASVFNLAQGPPSLTPITVSANGTFALPTDISPKFRPETVTLPTVYQYNLSLQRQLTNRIAVTGAYVGNQNRHGFNGTSNTININEPEYIPADSANQALARPYYAKFGLTQDLGGYYCDCANEMYNSFQGQIKVNALQGWTLQGSYTYQRQYGGGWGYDSNYYFLYDRAAGEGYSNLIPNQQWTLAQSYEIPFGRGRRYAGNLNHVADLVLGGWNTSGIMTYYSGFGFSPSLENYGSQGGQPYVNGGRPNVGTGNPYAGAQGNRNQWFVGDCTSTGCPSNSAFAIPAADTFGNYPINVLYGPQFINLDLSLMKTFHLTERLGFTLRTDARNALNHTNLGTPNGDVQSPNAGQITGLAAGTGGYMRTLQFSGTLAF